MKICVTGNCNVDLLLSGITTHLSKLHIKHEMFSTDYDSWVSVIQNDHISTDYWIIWLSSLGATKGGTQSYNLDPIIVASLIKKLIDTNAKVFLILPERLEISFDMYSPLYNEYRNLKNNLIANLPNEAITIDPEIIHCQIGSKSWYAGRYWSTFKIPCHPDAVADLASYIGGILIKSIRPECKAIIVDLDNTLWGGVVGEDGVDNLLLDANSDGRPYIQLQFFLKRLAQHGLPLSVVSKNDLADAQSPFLLREEMVLKLDDFVCFIANWEHKAQNIIDIATRLNLTLDSICFLDDSIYERTAVKTALQDLIVPDLPSDPDERVGMLIRSGIFTNPILSSDDLKRNAYYKTEMQRINVEINIDPDQYLEDLCMALEVMKINASNMQRVVGLINKTNQFNTTTKRYTEAEIAKLINNKDTYAYCYRLKDKFGDSGIIGVLLALKNNNHMYIDTFLMSCRVLNRKVEYAIFDHFLKWIAERDIVQITAEYIPTVKNVLVADLYSRLGLTVMSRDNNKAVYTGNVSISVNHPINIYVKNSA